MNKEERMQMLRNLKTLMLDMEVVTPLFISGADQNQAELRSSSIKGALRFWWRALYGSDDLQRMYENESALFGSTDQKSLVGVVISKSKLKDRKPNFRNEYKYLLEYLAYGYKNPNAKPPIHRSYIQPGSLFTLKLKYPDSYEEGIKDAVAYWLNYGGLGSSVRNGFGCLHTESFTRKTPIIKSGGMKEFTCFSNESRLFSSSKHDTWEGALTEIGDAYKEARSVLKNEGLDRSLIGLPFKGNNKRHAKPYFLHVNKLEDGRFQGQVLYLPYKYDKNSRNEYSKACNIINNHFESKLKKEDSV